MKINQVEELTGITKKNIRFYESEGLISPGRDPANGYREYSLADAETLLRIRLLRKLDISCEQIRDLEAGRKTLQGVLDDHLIRLSHKSYDLQQTRKLCQELMEEVPDLSHLGARDWLERMKEMEKGGVRFMDVKESDVKKRRTGAIAAAAVSIGFFLLLLTAVLWANSEDPAPAGVLALILVIIGAVILGILLSLRQRLDEVKKGEIDEASKY